MIQWNEQPYAGDFEGRTALVTGGAGFIGSHLARALLELGASVRIIDDLSTGHAHNLPEAATFERASILDDEPLRRLTKGCDFVFHHAAMMSVPLSVERPTECVQINVIGTERVLEASKDLDVRRLVFAATSAAYGENAVMPSAEDHPTDCRSPYAASKVAGEVLLTAFSHCFGLSTIALRYFNVYGPGQDPKSAYAAAISAFADALIHERPPTVFGTGEQTRDFVHVDNVVHANLLAASCSRSLKGDVVNVGTGHRISLLDVIALMNKELGLSIDPVFDAPRAGDVMHTLPDISRARDLIGFEPLISFEDGLGETLTWMQGQPA